MTLEGLAKAVSSGRVTAQTELTDRYGAGDGDRPLPGAVAFPVDVEDVSRAVDWAAGQGVSIVPFSSAAPHSTERPAGEWVAIDLSGMNGVVRTDRRNRVALIEPGVTFGQLEDALKPVGLRAMTPLAPRSGKSVLAAYLDRTPTLVPRAQWDLSDPLLCIEAVMGTGKVFRTGCSAGPGTLEQQWSKGQAQKNPMGPSSFDYFRLVQGSRGALGIVTWASVKCELRPRESEAMAFGRSDLGPLVELVYRASHAKWGEEMVLLDRVMADAVLGWPDAPAWSLLMNVTGWDYRPAERVAYQSKGIREMARSLGLASARSGPLTAREAVKRASAPRETDWRDRDGAHRSLYFLSTLERAPGFAACLDDWCDEVSLPRGGAGMYVQPQLGGRVAHVEMTLFLDADDDSRGDAMVILLARKMKEQGAYFSRPAGPWAGLAYEGHPLLQSTLDRTKKIFDPAGILGAGALIRGEVA